MGSICGFTARCALDDLHGRSAVDAGAAANGDEALDEVSHALRLQMVPEHARCARMCQYVHIACSAAACL